MKSQGYACFWLGLFFATSASAQVNTPLATPISGGSPIPSVLQNRQITDPYPRVYSPGFGLMPPTLVREGEFGFAYPVPWGPWQKNIRFECNNFLHMPQPGTMRITWQRRQPSFGHDHYIATGPAGKFDGHDSPYVFSTTRSLLYETPDSAGIVDVTMECDNNGITQEFVMGIGVRGLFPLEIYTGDEPFELIGETCEDLFGTQVKCADCTYEEEGQIHFGSCPNVSPLDPAGVPVRRHNEANSHNGVPKLIDALWELARRYEDATGDKLQINDMSLPYGGTFDIEANWVNPHLHHSLGIDVDLGIKGYTNEERSKRAAALDLIDQVGLEHLVEYRERGGLGPFPTPFFEDRSHLHVVLKEWS